MYGSYLHQLVWYAELDPLFLVIFALYVGYLAKSSLDMECKSRRGRHECKQTHVSSRR